MIEFIRKLDCNGLGLCDGHAFNTTLHEGKFVFLDFDALKVGKTHYHTLQNIIDTHILILLLLSESLMDKAYLYLNNPNEKLCIKDVRGYLTGEKYNEFSEINSKCYENSTNGNIQKCCDILEQYIYTIEVKHIVDSTWEGYQEELYLSIDKKEWTDKQCIVLEMVRSAQPRTLIDLAGNMGWFEYVLKDELESCIVADLDYNCVDFVFDIVNREGIKNIYSIYLNLAAPTPASYKGLHIGDTAIIPWRKNAIERFKSEMVLALAVVHHLAFSQQLSFAEIIGQLAMYTTKWMVIEFVDRDDCIVKPALSNTDFDWYNRQEFEKELQELFYIREIKNSNPTRILYLCQKK